MEYSKFMIMNCPINEETSDGALVGRCWFHLENGKTCERHGDVSAALIMFKSTGNLVNESDFYALPKLPKPPLNRLLYETDTSLECCHVCGSSLRRKYNLLGGYIRLFKTTKCIQPKCDNYWSH